MSSKMVVLGSISVIAVRLIIIHVGSIQVRIAVHLIIYFTRELRTKNSPFWRYISRVVSRDF